MLLKKTKFYIFKDSKFVKNLVIPFDSLGLNNPILSKITLNRGLGIFAQNNLLLKMTINEFRLITGQHPFLTYSKKSIAGFKLRADSLIGVSVTLRKSKMYSFLDRLIHLSIPKLFDFKGFSKKNFDKHGNYNFSFKDQSLFPELEAETIIQKLGLNISFIFSTKDITQNFIILSNLGFPFS
uniref:50S ribosomal protein L5, chloroplastic n=1 Tax=Pteridomonas danica TaxID=38822 RepID=A0A7T1C519_9STRA|nr:ribosomal protein L5 [Pteridomonas danica]QPM99292.1 ribosomal protein L5 [Pteridomonas danica]